MVILAQEPVANMLIITALLAAVVVVMVLRVMAGELEWGVRLHRLKIDAYNLRLRQYQQIAEMKQHQQAERQAQQEKREQRDRKLRDVMGRNANRGFGIEDDEPTEAGDTSEAVAGVTGSESQLAQAA